jgi:hypothetical protein
LFVFFCFDKNKFEKDIIINLNRIRKFNWMDNRPDENSLVNNHIPKSRFLKTDLNPVMSLGLLTGYFAYTYF